MINNTENRIIYNGNGSATEFAFPFRILNRTDIKVVIVDANGVETLLTKDYYVDMEKDVIIYPGYAPGAEPPASEQPPILPNGWQIALYREVPITQESRLDEYWPFNVIEAMADKLTMICQQLWDGVSRSFRLSSASNKDIDTTIPVGAGKSFRWDDEGKRLVLMENPESVLAENKNILEQVKGLRTETEGYKDTTEEYMNTTANYMNNAAGSSNLAERWAQAPDSPDGAEGNASSKTWAERSKREAKEAAAAADRAEAAGEKAQVYDPEHTYSPGDVVMTAEGDTYRCVVESTGENPNDSNKWVLITQVKYETFELDANGDLQPLYIPKTSTNFQIDENGDIMPIED